MTYSFVGVEDVYVPIAVISAESRKDGSCSLEIHWSPWDPIALSIRPTSFC